MNISGIEIPDEMVDLIERADEPLHPDLEDCVREYEDGMKIVHHPLVVTPLASPALVNDLYESKQEQVAKAIEKHDWHRAVWLHERAYRLDALDALSASELISPSKLGELLKDVWPDIENSDYEAGLVAMFRRAGFVTDTSLEGPPEESVELYRGGEFHMGLSWTTSLETARFFAGRHVKLRREKRKVWQAVAPPESILAVLRQRGESEVVVDPTMLEEVEELENA